MVLGPFAETKGPRLPGLNPATQRKLIMAGRRCIKENLNHLLLFRLFILVFDLVKI